MDTELLIQFNAQWHGIRDVVLSEAKRQMVAGGKVDARLLTVKLHEETAKWQRGVLVRGVWFKAFKVRHHADAVCPCKKQAQGIF